MTTNGLPPVTMMAVVMAMAVGYVTCDCPNARHTALTYNTALGTTVHAYYQRQSTVVQAIKDQGPQADFMCLQELWFEEDVRNVLTEMKDTFEHHWSPIHAYVGNLRAPLPKPWWSIFKPDGWDTTPCETWELTRLLACISWNCRSSENQRQCLIEQCEESLNALSQNCRSCFTVASSSAKDIGYKCANVFKKFNKINRPGLMVLSKHPLTRVYYTNYHPGSSVMLERGFIRAEVKGGHTYICTHLTAVFPYYFEVGLPQFSSFLEEQEAEIRELSNTLSNIPHVVLGDLNTGPYRDVPNLPVLGGEAPQNYDILIEELHYQSPYLENNGNCTYCPMENPVLKAAKSEYADLAIDHILTSPGVTADITSAKRVFDRHDIMLSDHFGVQVDLCLP